MIVSLLVCVLVSFHHGAMGWSVSYECCNSLHARIQRGGGGRKSRPPHLKKSQNYRVP